MPYELLIKGGHVLDPGQGLDGRMDIGISAGEIAAIINEEAFDDLDGPIVRITAQDSPVPFSPPQEEYFLPKVTDVVREARRLKEY